MCERGLAVPTVELAPTGTSDVSEHTVEHATLAFVKVQTAKEKLAEEAS
jgi:hypothetical protein